MFDQAWTQAQSLLGLGSDIGDVNSIQMAFRTVVIYLSALIVVRLASQRFLSKASAFDVIVAIMLGSIMSRAINGSAPLVPTVAAGAVLLGLHWLFATLAFHTSWFGDLVKGRRVLLIEDGEVQAKGMRKTGLTQADLAEALRLQTGHTDPAKVRRAYLERNGKISVQTARQEPRVVEVAARPGVQTLRIEF